MKTFLLFALLFAPFSANASDANCGSSPQLLLKKQEIAFDQVASLSGQTAASCVGLGYLCGCSHERGGSSFCRDNFCS